MTIPYNNVVCFLNVIYILYIYYIIIYRTINTIVRGLHGFFSNARILSGLGQMGKRSNSDNYYYLYYHFYAY